MDIVTEFINKVVRRINRINKKLLMLLFMFILFVIIIITFIVGSINSKRAKECKELYNSVGVLVEDYLTQKNIYPYLLGTSVTVDLSDLEPVYFKEKLVTGYVKYTKYTDGYIKTFYLENCKYCSSKEFGKETDSYKADKNNMDVVAYYNYYDASYYNTYWTNYLEPEKISNEATMGVNLPIDTRLLPSIPSDGQVVEYIKEDKTYYSYRDLMYKYYRNNIQYSGFSSERPTGYTKKDPSTEIKTEATDWSLDYPEEKDYRTISRKASYKWYYEENGKKIYWNNGAYYPTQPDEKYNKNSKETATMYSYVDRMWKWYNGTTARLYSSYSRTLPNYYYYKDSDLYQYTSWTPYAQNSTLSPENMAYREERTKTYSRYMIKYRVLSFAKLEEPVTQQELEQKTGKSLETLMNEDNTYVEVTFKFKY